MSRLFVQNTEGWEARALEGERYGLGATGDGTGPSVFALDGGACAPTDVMLLRVAEAANGGGVGWALLADSAARVLMNGAPLTLGLALLRHRDELRLPGAAPLYFSAERRAAVEPCAREDAPRCPRCAQPIARGEPAVRCPGCGVLHHELPDRSCWTYLASCALCPQATALDAGLAWTPEEL